MDLKDTATVSLSRVDNLMLFPSVARCYVVTVCSKTTALETNHSPFHVSGAVATFFIVYLIRFTPIQLLIFADHARLRFPCFAR